MDRRGGLLALFVTLDLIAGCWLYQRRQENKLSPEARFYKENDVVMTSMVTIDPAGTRIFKDATITYGAMEYGGMILFHRQKSMSRIFGEPGKEYFFKTDSALYIAKPGDGGLEVKVLEAIQPVDD